MWKAFGQRLLASAGSVADEGELRQAISRFDAAARRAAIFESSTLADADSVLTKTLYNYQRGGATLVEMLVDCARAASDVHLAGLDALADRPGAGPVGAGGGADRAAAPLRALRLYST